MKFYLVFVSLLNLFSGNVFVNSELLVEELNLNSNAYILYNLEHDEIIVDKNSNLKVTQASITKIMTVLVALEYYEKNNIDLNSMFTIPESTFDGLWAADASLAGFSVNETVTLSDLLHGAILPSGADATQALALTVSDSILEFIDLMNGLAEKLEMSDTVYKNTSGLDEEGHYTTVFDQLKLLKYAYNNEMFKTLISTAEYRSSSTIQHPEGIFMRSTLLRFLSSDINTTDYFYNETIIGGKTGYTIDAGLALASISHMNDETYMFVSVGADYTVNKRGHIEDAVKIYNLLHAEYAYREILSSHEIYETIEIEKANIDYLVKVNESVFKFLENSIDDEDINIIFKQSQSSLIAPLEEGTFIGTLEVLIEEEVIYSQEFYVEKTIQKRLIFIIIEVLIQVFLIMILFVLALLLILVMLKKRKRKLNR